MAGFMSGIESNHRKIKILVLFLVVLAVAGFVLWNKFLSDRAREAKGWENRGIIESLTFSENVTGTNKNGNTAVDPWDPLFTHPFVTGENAGNPVRIRIPGISVDAEIERVGLTKNGLMDVPKSPWNTAWYKPGARPGETGSAAIAGHVDWVNGERAVFADLKTLKTGDKISILDDKGAVINFVVHKSKTYDAEADAVDVFTSTDGKAHLNLITCKGEWDKTAKQYTERLVVFTDKE